MITRRYKKRAEMNRKATTTALLVLLAFCTLTAPANGQRDGESEPPFIRAQLGVVGWYGGQAAIQIWPVNFGFSGRIMRGFRPSFLEVDALAHIGPPQLNVFGGVGARRSGPKEDDKLGPIWIAGIELNTASAYRPAGWGFWIDYHRALGDESTATTGFTVGLNLSAALGF